jgi:hypothetical protein
MGESLPDIWPATIVRARYQGSYEPGAWLAFPLDPDALPADWQADDVSCALFWRSYGGTVGAASSPNQALADLARKLEGNR